MTNKYPTESPTPDWPKELNPKHFSVYCDPVLDAVTSGIDRVLQSTANDPCRILDSKAILELKNKWRRAPSELSPKELQQLQTAYALQVDVIHMLGDY